jgi:uncharacterized protein
MRKTLYVGMLFVWMCCFLCNSGFTEPKIKALIINGQMKYNHRWIHTTPVLWRLLQETNLFQTDIITTPPKEEPLDQFRPNFSNYDVVILNNDGERWPKETETAFVDYIKNGGGLVVYHEANNAFPDWPEYNEIIGVGGWNGRTEKHGPMVYWDGEMKLDNTPGPGGAHGKQREYAIHTRAPEHPIMKGLPAVWMHAPDELYAKLRGPARNMEILATGQSLLTNRHEPLLFTIRYGKGRVFHTCLGHDEEKLRCVGFITTYQRGTEWAATGKVSIPVPKDFPTAEQVSIR